MTLYEGVTMWTALALYAVAWIAVVAGMVFRRERWLAWSRRLTLAAVAAHTLAMVARWATTGHLPVVADYENALAGTWMVAVALLLVVMRWPSLGAGSILVHPLILLVMGYGLMKAPGEPTAMTPAYQSPWLWVHVLFAWFSYASFTVASALGMLYLLRERRSQDDGWWRRLPSLEEMDDLAYRLIAFGFVMAAVMLVSGSIWANRLWGSYWSWDPVETWSLVSWLVYGLYLHLRLIHGWRGKRAAWYAVLALITVLISFWGVNLLQAGLHVFQLM